MHRSSNNISTKGGVAPMYRHPGCASSDATQRSAHYKSKFDATRRELAAAREAAAQAARERAEADEEAHAARAAAAREEAAIAALANSAVSRQRADALAQRVLAAELRVCEEALAAAQRHAGGLATRNRLLVQEVRELREQLADRGGQRVADAYRTRDAALDALDARDARLQELGATLSEQGHQLERTEHAARVAHALYQEAVHGTEEANEEAAEADAAERAALEARARAQRHAAEARAAAAAERAQRQAAEARARRQAEKSKQLALEASRRALEERLRELQSPSGAATPATPEVSPDFIRPAR